MEYKIQRYYYCDSILYSYLKHGIKIKERKLDDILK